jgi:hypothetical protein
VGKSAASTDPATGAMRDRQIVAIFGHSCQTPTTTGKIERPQKRGIGQEGSAILGHSQKAKGASTCSILTASLTLWFAFFLFHRTSGEVLVESFSLKRYDQGVREDDENEIE